MGDREIPHYKIRADLESQEIAGVNIHFLSPDQEEQNKFTKAYQQTAESKRKGFPDPNALPAIIALEFGGSVIVLGADGLKKNWEGALKKYRRLVLPSAAVLKVPHHGASNALRLEKGASSYLDICSSETIAVRFAGDLDHPEERVNGLLLKKTSLGCLANGLRGCQAGLDQNPLGIGLPGARAVSRSVVPCQSHISVELLSDGGVKRRVGHGCDTCQIANQ